MSNYFHLVGAFLSLIWFFHFWLCSPGSSESSQGLADEKSSTSLEWHSMTTKDFFEVKRNLSLPRSNTSLLQRTCICVLMKHFFIFIFLPYYFSDTHQTVFFVTFVCFPCMRLTWRGHMSPNFSAWDKIGKVMMLPWCLEGLLLQFVLK